MVKCQVGEKQAGCPRIYAHMNTTQLTSLKIIRHYVCI